jgi:hypothetical protein
MRKGLAKDKVQRMRNLVSGNYGDKTKIQTGFVNTKLVYVEGDIWESKGKTWTIKNGIKQTINKLDEARKAIRVPLTCPKCNDPRMTKLAYKKIYMRYGFCPNCLAKFEKQLRKDGLYDDYVSKLNKSSNESWIRQMTAEYQDWLESRDSDGYITESGDIEDWTGGESKESLEAKFVTRQEEVKKQLEESNEHPK